MTPLSRSPEPVDWRTLTGLGEKIVSTTSLSAQKDQIINTTQRLISGEVQVWLHEDLFRLPNWDAASIFPPEPNSEEMRAAFTSGSSIIRSSNDEGSGGVLAAFPLEDQGLILGVIQISDNEKEELNQGEKELLEALASVISVGLIASHRVAVEQFRLNQINLVREVSAQIANVMNLDDLARKITKLIQQTFNYYYVGIFTCHPGDQKLLFRSSASAPRNKNREPDVSLEIEMGQGLIGQAAYSGERIVVEDVNADNRYRYIPILPNTKSEVVLPLIVEDRVVGVLDVQSEQLQAFHPNDLIVLDALAANVARAVESANLYSNLRRRTEQLELIAEVSQTITSSLNLNEIMQKTTGLIHQKFGFPLVHLYSVYTTRRRVIYAAGSGDGNHELNGNSYSLDDPLAIVSKVARTGEMILANGINHHEHIENGPKTNIDIKSELYVPLIFDQKVVGVLNVQSERPNAFTEGEKLIFNTLAGNIASAIHNARLYKSEQWRHRVADSLRQVAVLLSANVDVDQVLDSILSELNKTLPVDVSAIWLFDEGVLHLSAVHGCALEKLENARKNSPEASIALMNSLVSDKPTIRNPEDAKCPSGLAASFNDSYSSITAPLRIGDQLIGILSLAHAKPDRYGHESQAMTTTFASYASVAIENARLFDSSQEQAYTSAALLQVSRAVVNSKSLNESLSAIIRIIPILIGIDKCALYLWDPEKEAYCPSQEYGLTRAEKAAFWNKEISKESSPLLAAACRHARVIADQLSENETIQDWMDKKVPDGLTEKSFLKINRRLHLAVPLLIKDDIFGIILLKEAPKGLRFRNRRLEIINGIAQQAALVIQNDRLQEEKIARDRLETEIQLARKIQKSFIPDELPNRSGWDLAARWRTAGQVGGDFYDAMEFPDGRIGLFIADVADKGMPAALFMALTRTLVRAAVKETQSPAEALRRVNDLLIPDTKQGMFVTAVYVVLYPQTGKLVYANAGHNPPLWLNREGKLKRLTRTSIALGVIDGEDVEERSLVMKKGDNLLLYTDGLNEALSSNEKMFGEKRIIKAFKASKEKSAENIIRGIEDELDQFVGQEPQFDDQTLLLIKKI
ncbi:MAG: GAF domain-containing protein [Anaerolineae bacterium]|nr:GAF domain-containing protein [Anaerolineae bacterium]